MDLIWNDFSKAESTPPPQFVCSPLSEGSGIHASLRGRGAPQNGVGVEASIYKREPSETQVIHEVTRPEPVPTLTGRVSWSPARSPALTGHGCERRRRHP